MKLQIENNRNLWVFSDPHAYHTNICAGVTKWRDKDGNIPTNKCRLFDNVEEMTDKIINNLNDNIKTDDYAICLGDWSFGGFQNIEKFRERILCKNIFLVLGNHDHHIEANKDNVRKNFLEVADYIELRYCHRDFKLFHNPIDSWTDLNKGAIHLHGHCHLPKNKKFGKGRRLDVGLDGNDLLPYNVKEEIIPTMLSRPVVSNITDDHHVDDTRNVDNNKESYQEKNNKFFLIFNNE